MTRAAAHLLATALLALGLLAPACKSSAQSDLPQGVALEEGTRLEVVFQGQEEFDSERLAEVIAPDLEGLERRRSVRAAIDDAAYSLELFYRGQGFPACAVRYETPPMKDRVQVARLLIDEGPHVRIGAVRFEGVESLDPDELRGFVLPAKRWGFLPRRRVPFVASRVQDSVDAVAAYYRSMGFLDARAELVAPDPREGPWKEDVTVRIRVEEGPRYTVRHIELVGGVERVDRGFNAQALVDEGVHPRLATTLKSRLSEHYARAGYPDARVEAEQTVDPEHGLVDIRLEIEPGPLVTIGDVRIEGDVRTSRSRILGALTLEEGDRFDVEEQRESFRNLYRLGVFSSVNLQLEPRDDGSAAAGEPQGDASDAADAADAHAGEGAGAGAASAPAEEVRDLRLQLEEAPSREVYVEPGYGSYERIRGVLGWRERNLFGSARALSIEAAVSELAQRGTIELSDPRLLDSDSSATVALFGGRRQEPSFLRSDAGVTTTLDRRLSQRLRLALAYQYRYSGVEAGDLNDPLVQELLDDVNISSISLTPTWDTRDNVFFPSEGDLARVGIEWGDTAIGSELDFLRGRWALAHFLSLDEDSVLGLSWRGGVIAPIHASDSIPIQERFFNGGENTVRSFKEDELGPKDSSGKPIGGEAYNVFTAELRQRLVGRLELGLFWDVGNVVEDHADYLAFADLRQALGVGLRYALPVGPIRLDFGWNPDPRDDEAHYAIHLSVGLSF